MKTKNVNINNTIRRAALPLAISLALCSNPLTVLAKSLPAQAHAKQVIEKYKNSKDKLAMHKEVVKEALDAFKATETALKALQNNQPKQALAALEVVSGNLHLLLARDPSLGLIPVDIRVQVLEGETRLKRIKELEDELEDLIDDGHYQAARPLVDSLVDEIRVTTTYLPLAIYPAVIDEIAPLIDAEKIDEAEVALITVLDTLVTEQEITPLAVIRAEGNLTQAFQLEHKKGLSKQEIKTKIQKLVGEATQHIQIAEALGYGTEDDFKGLEQSIDALNTAIRNEKIRDEWNGIKKSLSKFKNKIVHPSHRK